MTIEERTPMRIIHTADWHLCDKLGRLDRTDDLKTRVERVAVLCEEHAVDVLLIAGDLFSEQASVEQMTAALQNLHKTFTTFFSRGGTIVAITGNHDRDQRIELIRAGMKLVAPSVAQGGELLPGRLYLLNGLFFARITARAGDTVQFVLVPYPFPSRFDLTEDKYRTHEERSRLLHDHVAQWLQGMQHDPRFDKTLPTVLAAHLHVRGADVHSLHKLTERDDVVFDFADLNPNWAYVALGHIHKPQTIGRQANVRYCGSLDRLSFGETHDDHGVLLVEVGRAATVGEAKRLPIPATPFHTIKLADPEAELPTLAERYPDRDTAIVRVEATHTGAGLSRDEVNRALRRLFPRLHELKWADTSPERDASTKPAFTPREGFAATVRGYLAEQLKDDADKDAMLELAEAFLAEGEAP